MTARQMISRSFVFVALFYAAVFFLVGCALHLVGRYFGWSLFVRSQFSLGEAIAMAFLWAIAMAGINYKNFREKNSRSFPMA